MPKIKVKRRKKGVLWEGVITLAERWEEIERLLASDTKIIRKHKEQLFGPDSGIEINSLFSELSLCKRDGVPSYHEFMYLPLSDRARYLAFARIDSMKEIIERHDSLMKKNIEDAFSK